MKHKETHHTSDVSESESCYITVYQCYNQLHDDITAFREKERVDDKSDDNSLKNNMKTMTINMKI